MSYTLKYFPVRGKVHHIRYLLEDNKLKYTEDTVSFEDWFSKVKPTVKFGQLPVFKDGSFELTETGAIVRYLARKHKLYGSNDQEAGLCDMWTDVMVDMRDRVLKLVFMDGDFDTAKKEFDTKIVGELANIEKLFKENKGGNGFFVGSKISFADYAMYDFFVNVQVFTPGCLDKCPLLKGFVSRMAARPNMAKYIASDKFKKIPITPKPRLS